MPQSPLENPTASATTSVAALFDLMARLIRFEEFVTVCGAEDFPALYGLALLDRYTTYPEEERATRIAIAVEQLPALREHPAYERIGDRMKETMATLSSAATMDALTEILEPAMARELAKIALGMGREAAAAQASFLDRRSAKVPRGKGVRGQTLVLTEGAAKTIMDGEARAQKLVPPAAKEPN